MSQTCSKTPRRQPDGSIDTAYYLAVGRQRRSQQGIRFLAQITTTIDQIWGILIRDMKNKSDVRLHFKN